MAVMTKDKPTLIDSPVLDKVWWQWLEWERDRLGVLTGPEEWLLTRRVPYNQRPRSSRKAERFEIWLFQQGAEVRKIHGKKYLEFADEHNASLFALKWS